MQPGEEYRRRATESAGAGERPRSEEAIAGEAPRSKPARCSEERWLSAEETAGKGQTRAPVKRRGELQRRAESASNGQTKAPAQRGENRIRGMVSGGGTRRKRGVLASLQAQKYTANSTTDLFCPISEQTPLVNISYQRLICEYSLMGRPNNEYSLMAT